MTVSTAVEPRIVHSEQKELTKDEQKELGALTTRLHKYLAATVQHIVEVGKDLIKAKALVGHGQFLNWLEKEFDLSDQSARRFMQVAEVFGERANALKGLSLRSIYLLAAPSMPEVVRDTVLKQLESGKTISFNEIQMLKDKEEAIFNPQENVVSQVSEVAFRTGIKGVNKKISHWSERIKKNWTGLDGILHPKSKQELEELRQNLSQLSKDLEKILSEAKEIPRKSSEKV